MAVEDFTTYTKTDPDSTMTVTSTNAAFALSGTRYKTYTLNKDMGAGHFENFTHLLKCKLQRNDAGGTAMEIVHWQVSNQTGDGRAGEIAAEGLQVYSYGYDGTPYQFGIETNNNTSTNFYTPPSIAPGSIFYVKISRSGTTFQMLVYTDSGRTNLVSTLSLTCPTTTYRYIQALAGYNDGVGSPATTSGYSDSLDLQESSSPTFIPRLTLMGCG